MLGFGEIANFRSRMMIWKSVPSNFVGRNIEPRQIEQSGFFYLTATDKLEFTDWSQVTRMFGCVEIAIFPVLTRVKTCQNKNHNKIVIGGRHPNPHIVPVSRSSCVPFSWYVPASWCPIVKVSQFPGVPVSP